MPGANADILHARVLQHLGGHHHHDHHLHQPHLKVHHVIVAGRVAVIIEHHQLGHVAELKITKVFLNIRL